MMSSNSIFMIRPFSFILYTFQNTQWKWLPLPNMFQKNSKTSFMYRMVKCTFELRNTKLHKPNSWRNNSSIKFNIGKICKLYIRYLPGGVTRRILFIKAIHDKNRWWLLSRQRNNQPSYWCNKPDSKPIKQNKLKSNQPVSTPTKRCTWEVIHTVKATFLSN